MTVQTQDRNLLRVGLAQIAPVWLDRDRTLLKVETYVEQAARQGCHLVVFGEALVPRYPFWPELTDGARFNSALQKSIFAEYATRRRCNRMQGISLTDCAQPPGGIASQSIWAP